MTTNRSLIVVLCLGYFIDFYDLTIFSSSYIPLIRDMFNITNINEIQLLYLKITNFYTVGIVLGAITSGVLGDKYGRSFALRYSILLYSLAIIASVFTHSIWLFTFLRFLSGFGLATEFATSTVLIKEIFSQSTGTKAVSILYVCGVFGGIFAALLSSVSWKLVFLFGGISGILLYFFRKNIIESSIFLLQSKVIKKGSILLLFNKKNIKKTVCLFVAATPFYYLICVMMIYPKYMLIGSIEKATTIVLIGFFIGSILSSFLSQYIVNKYQSYRKYMRWSVIAFMIVLFSFYAVTTDIALIVYAVMLGMLGGGYPITLMQLTTKSYGTNIRNTASNVLYGSGRFTSILFNLIMAFIIQHEVNFFYYNTVIVLTIGASVLFSIYLIQENYSKSIDFIDV